MTTGVAGDANTLIPPGRRRDQSVATNLSADERNHFTNPRTRRIGLGIIVHGDNNRTRCSQTIRVALFPRNVPQTASSSVFDFSTMDSRKTRKRSAMLSGWAEPESPGSRRSHKSIKIQSVTRFKKQAQETRGPYGVLRRMEWSSCAESR